MCVTTLPTGIKQHKLSEIRKSLLSDLPVEYQIADGVMSGASNSQGQDPVREEPKCIYALECQQP